MNLRAKVYVEKQKMNAQVKLEAYLAGLKGKGTEPQALQKDTTVRKLRALIRQANSRLASIAAQEKLIRDLAQAKLAKLAAAQTPSEEFVEKKAAPVKKEKKAKKEKAEKAESKKDKKEKKAPKEEEK
jgi:hypothetical protein